MAKSCKKTSENSRLTESLEKHKVPILISIALIVYILIRLYAADLPITDRWAETSNAPDKETLSQQLKGIYKDADGGIYLYGVDPYKFLGQARDITNGGKADSLLPYLEAYSYLLLSFFNRDISLMQVAFWLPFIITMFSIILIFFIARKLTNDIGGFFAAFILAIHPQFFTATQAGFTDTNFLNLFFTLLIVFLFFEGIDLKANGVKGSWKTIILLALIIPIAFLFKWTWNGWFYILFIILLFSVLYSILFLGTRLKERLSKKYALMLAAIILLAVIIPFFLKDDAYIDGKVARVKDRIGMYEQNTYFPSSAALTSELLSAPDAQKLKKSAQGPILYILNGWVLAILAIISILLIFKDNLALKSRTKYALFIILWFAIMFFVGYKSIRFISFFAIPFSILLSYSLTVIFSSLVMLAKKRFVSLDKMIVTTVIGLILMLIILIPVKATLQERVDKTPIMVNIIEKTADGLKKSDETSMVNMWWDKGFIYSYYTGRKVLMDNGVGGTSDPRMYWFSRAILSSDESESINTFKMLDCMVVNGNPLAGHNTNLSSINCSPFESYVLLDNGLIGKIETFNYFRNWDFEAQTKTPFSPSEIPLISAPSICRPSDDKSHLICAENFDIDLKEGRLTYKGVESPFVMVLDGTIYQSSAKGPYTLLVYPETYGNERIYKAVLVKSDMLDSMFVRLYFMNGYGLEHFEPYSDITDPVAGRIVVYKIKWQA